MLPQIAGSISVVALASVGLHFAMPIFDALGNPNLIVFFLGLVAICLVIGMPIGLIEASPSEDMGVKLDPRQSPTSGIVHYKSD